MWRAGHDGATANVSLFLGSTRIAEHPTPLRVTHAANCSDAAPTLFLELDAAVSALTVGGYDVAATLALLGATPSAPLVTNGTGDLTIRMCDEWGDMDDCGTCKRLTTNDFHPHACLMPASQAYEVMVSHCCP